MEESKVWDEGFNDGWDAAIEHIQKHVYGYLEAKRDGELSSTGDPMDVWIPRLLAIALDTFEGWQKPKMRRTVTLEMLLANLEASRNINFWELGESSSAAGTN